VDLPYIKKCKKAKDSSNVSCTFLKDTNNCYRRNCCTSRYSNKKRVSHTCRTGQRQCRLIVRRACIWKSKNECRRRHCCRTISRDGVEVFKTCRKSIRRDCPTITRRKCKWNRLSNGCQKKKVCCVSRWRAQVRIFNTCYSGETKCKRIQKRSCWNKESKSLKRGKCHIKSCCDVRLNHNTKKLKTIKKTCSRHVSCIKNAVHTHQRCHWRAETNECRRRVCCKNKYLNGSLLSRKCKRGTLHCPTKRFTSCRWKDSTNKCKERKCCTKVFRAGRIISNKCKLARRKCQNSNKNKMFMEKRRKM